MKKILIIGIGAGNPDYVTMQAVNALNQVDVFFIMDKGPSKAKLLDRTRPRSAYAQYLPDGDTHTHQGHRVVDGQRAMQLTSDPFLGYTTIDGRDYLVRQLNDHKASLDLSTLSPDSLL